MSAVRTGSQRMVGIPLVTLYKRILSGQVRFTSQIRTMESQMLMFPGFVIVLRGHAD